MRCLILFAISISIAFSADFTTYIGGAITQLPYSVSDQYTTLAIATDSAGNTYATGSTDSDSNTYAAGSNAFVAKVDPSGNIVFRITLGPNEYGAYTQANAIAVDPAGNIWIAGQTTGQIQLVNPIQSTPVANGVGFLMKIAPDQTVLYASYFGGQLGNSGIYGIATDSNGNVYVTGWTNALDFHATPGLPASPVAGGSLPIYGAFVAKLDPTGQKILYSTVIAGAAGCASPESCFANASKTVGLGIAVDGSGEALVAGNTNTTGLPDTPAGSGNGAFVFKITAAGNKLAYITFVPNSGAITSDAEGNAYLAGYAYGPDFPATAKAYQTVYDAGSNAAEGVALKLDPTGALVWATFLGGETALNPTPATPAIAVDSFGNVWLTGTNGVGPAPVQNYVDELSADGSKLLFSEEFPQGTGGQGIAVDPVDPGNVVHVAGTSSFISTLSGPNYLTSRPLSIVNAASGQLTGTIAFGEIVSIYGLGLGPTTGMIAIPQSNAGGTSVFPNSLGGVQVLVNGQPIPLLYVSASQINAEIPAPTNLLAFGMTDVQVVYNSTTLPDFRMAVQASDFATFQNEGSTAVINQDGTLNKIANPAKPGTVVSIWGTGFGTTGGPLDGGVETSASNYCSTCQVNLREGNISITETVQYAGTAPGLIDGVTQINFLLPADLSYASGGVFVYFTPTGASQPLNIGWVNVSQ